MNISYFNYHYNVQGSARGAAIQVETHAENLRQLGHKVNVHFRAAKQEAEEGDAGGRGITGWLKQFRLARKYLNVPRMYLRNFKFIGQEKRLIKEDQADVVLAVSSYMNFSALRAAQKTKVPFVLFCDGPMHYEYSRFWRQYQTYGWLGRHIERLNLRKADAVACVSEVFKGYLVNYGIDAEKIAVVPNGVDADRVKPGEKDEPLLDEYGLDGKTVAGFIGSFNFFDDVERVGSIVKRLLADYPELAFIFVGRGMAGEQLAGMLTKERDQRRVIFTGALPHSEAMRHLTLMDIVFTPYLGNYLFYGSSMKLMEYMAAGKAAIATGLGQIRELISSGHNGLLYEWGDFETLEQHFRTLIEKEDLRLELGRNARKTIEAGWTWKHQAKKLEKALQRAMG